MFDTPLQNLGRLLDEATVLVGEYGAFLFGDGAGLLVIYEAGFVPRLFVPWGFHVGRILARIQLQ